jgi:pyroglutamyl-peptidase
MTPPRLLLCGFGSFPEAPLNPSAAVIATLAREMWSPPEVETDYLTLPVQWRGSVEAILRQLQARPAQGVLVVGVAVGADSFRVETLGRNCAATERPDQAGRIWDSCEINSAGPDLLPASAPCEAMLQAIGWRELAAVASDDAGDYLCNFTLYRLLQARAADQIGFLHVPQARECASDAAFTLAQVQAAVCAAAEAFAADLSRRAAGRRTA